MAAAPAPPAEDPASIAARTLWIGDLPPTADEDWLASLFEGEGGGGGATEEGAPPALEAKVVRSRSSGGCAGYGFVSFPSPAFAADVLGRYAGAPMPGGWGGVFRLNWASGGAAKTDCKKREEGGRGVRGRARRRPPPAAIAARPTPPLRRAPCRVSATARHPQGPWEARVLGFHPGSSSRGGTRGGRAGAARRDECTLPPPPLFFRPGPQRTWAHRPRRAAPGSARPATFPSAHLGPGQRLLSGLLAVSMGERAAGARRAVLSCEREREGSSTAFARTLRLRPHSPGRSGLAVPRPPRARAPPPGVLPPMPA